MHIRTIVLVGGLALAGGTMTRAQDRPPNPLAPRAPFAGKFSGEGLVLELTAQGQGYAGSLTFQGQAMPCRAQAQGEGLAGTFNASGTEFPFEAVPDGQGGLRLSSGGRTYALQAEGARNPLGRGDGTAPAAGDLKVEAKHALGVAVRMPEGWAATEVQGNNVLMLPPGVDPQDPNAKELHLLMAVARDPSVSSPGDPRVAQYLDQVLAGTFPNLKRSTEPKMVETGAGPTAQIDWTGTAPNGQPVMGRAYVAIIGDNGAGVISIGFNPEINARDRTMRAIAGSMKAFASEMNPRLVGKWGNNGGWSIADRGAGGAHGSSRVEMTLGHGGQLHEFELRYVQTPAGIVESKEERHGTWQANGAVLTLRYQDGTTSSYRYQVTSEGLVCTGAGGSCTWLPSR